MLLSLLALAVILGAFLLVFLVRSRTGPVGLPQIPEPTTEPRNTTPPPPPEEPPARYVTSDSNCTYYYDPLGLFINAEPIPKPVCVTPWHYTTTTRTRTCTQAPCYDLIGRPESVGYSYSYQVPGCSTLPPKCDLYSLVFPLAIVSGSRHTWYAYRYNPQTATLELGPERTFFPEWELRYEDGVDNPTGTRALRFYNYISQDYFGIDPKIIWRGPNPSNLTSLTSQVFNGQPIPMLNSMDTPLEVVSGGNTGLGTVYRVITAGRIPFLYQTPEGQPRLDFSDSDTGSVPADSYSFVVHPEAEQAFSNAFDGTVAITPQYGYPAQIQMFFEPPRLVPAS